MDMDEPVNVDLDPEDALRILLGHPAEDEDENAGEDNGLSNTERPNVGP